MPLCSGSHRAANNNKALSGFVGATDHQGAATHAEWGSKPKSQTFMPELMKRRHNTTLPDRKQPHWHSALQERQPRRSRTGCEGETSSGDDRRPPMRQRITHLPGIGGQLPEPNKGLTALLDDNDDLDNEDEDVDSDDG